MVGIAPASAELVGPAAVELEEPAAPLYENLPLPWTASAYSPTTAQQARCRFKINIDLVSMLRFITMPNILPF